MIKKVMKAATVAVLAGSLMLSLCVNSFALPINVQMTDNYFYNEKAEAVSAPVAYRPVSVKGWDSLGVGSGFTPADMCVRDEYLYVVDKAQSQVIILDADYKVDTNTGKISVLKDSADYKVPDIDYYTYYDDGTREADSTLKNANKYNLNKPEGIYVDANDNIYIADTGNRRIVVCDKTGAVSNVIQSVRIAALGRDFLFNPKKVVVDSTGTVSCICEGVNKGLVQIDTTGSFIQFFAQPATQVAVSDWIYAIIGANSATKARITNIAAEYVNINIDGSGFIFTTATDTATVPALRKLATDGSDVLTQEDAKFTGFGDVTVTSKIVDVAINSSANTYTVLDSYMGRFFTYNSSGMQLFVGGGNGSQFGRFSGPVAIESFNDDLVIADSVNQTLTVYKTTDYALNIIQAQEAYKTGNYDVAEADWLKVTTYNSGMYIAYDTIGKIYKLRAADCEDDDPNRVEYYKTALNYFKLSSNKAGYAECYKEIRNANASDNFGLIFGSMIIIFVGIIVLIMVRKRKRKLAEERRRAGL